MNLSLCVEGNQQHGSSKGQILYAVTSLNSLGPEISGPKIRSQAAAVALSLPISVRN